MGKRNYLKELEGDPNSIELLILCAEEQSQNDNREEADKYYLRALEQAAVNEGIGYVGTLIRQENGYDIYVCEDKEIPGFFICLAFHLSGTATKMIINAYMNLLLKQSFKNLDEKSPWAKYRYTVRVGDNPVEVTKQGDNIRISDQPSTSAEYDFVGGWNKDGELLLARNDRNNVYVNTFHYIGYVKDNQLIFDENCRFED